MSAGEFYRTCVLVVILVAAFNCLLVSVAFHQHPSISVLIVGAFNFAIVIVGIVNPDWISYND